MSWLNHINHVGEMALSSAVTTTGQTTLAISTAGNSGTEKAKLNMRAPFVLELSEGALRELVLVTNAPSSGSWTMVRAWDATTAGTFTTAAKAVHVASSGALSSFTARLQVESGMSVAVGDAVAVYPSGKVAWPNNMPLGYRGVVGVALDAGGANQWVRVALFGPVLRGYSASMTPGAVYGWSHFSSTTKSSISDFVGANTVLGVALNATDIVMMPRSRYMTNGTGGIMRRLGTTFSTTSMTGAAIGTLALDGYDGLGGRLRITGVLHVETGAQDGYIIVAPSSEPVYGSFLFVNSGGAVTGGPIASDAAPAAIIPASSAGVVMLDLHSSYSYMNVHGATDPGGTLTVYGTNQGLTSFITYQDYPLVN